MENNVLELAKAIAEAYINGYKDGLKETAPKPEEAPEVTEEPTEARHYVRIHADRRTKRTRKGKSTTLIDENNRMYTFKSMRDANYFLGRGDNYINTAIARNKPIFDTQGNEYLLDEEDVG